MTEFRFLWELTLLKHDAAPVQDSENEAILYVTVKYGHLAHVCIKIQV